MHNPMPSHGVTDMGTVLDELHLLRLLQERPRPQRPLGENAAVAISNGPGSDSEEVTSKLRGPCSGDTSGINMSIGNGSAPVPGPLPGVSRCGNTPSVTFHVCCPLMN